MKDKRSLVIDELSSISKVEADRQLNSGMFVPLLVGDNLIGSISLLSRHRNHFTEQQVLFTETIAGQIATAIQQVSRIELRREQERLSAVLALARTAAHDLNQPLQVLQAELEFITKMGETPSPDTYHNMLLAIKDMTSKIREYQKIVRVETTEQVPGIRVIDRSRSLPTVPDKN
jgi:GAF domain-containing protein